MMRRVTWILIWAILLLSLPSDEGQPLAAQTAPGNQDGLVFWSVLYEPSLVERQRTLLNQFTADTGIPVRLVVMDVNFMDQTLPVVSQSGLLPDLILHPVSMTYPWYSAGYLDAQFATSAIEQLGRETFVGSALRMVTIGEGSYAAVPSDGWGYLTLYRRDWFEQGGLEVAPQSFETILATARSYHNLRRNRYGFCAPVTLFDNTSQQVEHFALASNVQLVNELGELSLSSSQLRDAMAFYANLLNRFGPPLNLTVANQSVRGYLAGNCGVLLATPAILDELAGLQQSALPTCPQCQDDVTFLLRNTGFVVGLQSEADVPLASWSNMFNIGIGLNAPQAAQTFINYYFNQAYLDWLSIAPELKQPMRSGTLENPTQFTDGWRGLTIGVDQRVPMNQVYSDDVLDTILAGQAHYGRLGLSLEQPRLPLMLDRNNTLARSVVALTNQRIDAEAAMTTFNDVFTTEFESMD